MLQSIGWQGVGHDWVTELNASLKTEFWFIFFPICHHNYSKFHHHTHTFSSISPHPLDSRGFTVPKHIAAEGDHPQLGSQPIKQRKNNMFSCDMPHSNHVVVVQWPSRVRLFTTSWTAARQASLSLTIFQSLPKTTTMVTYKLIPQDKLLLMR